VHGANLKGLIKFGVHDGDWTSMGPHKTTGRADYFRKCSTARPEYLVLPGDSRDYVRRNQNEMHFSRPGLMLLSGMEEEMNLFSCPQLLLPCTLPIRRRAMTAATNLKQIPKL
jgi:hypothetical protein